MATGRAAWLSWGGRVLKPRHEASFEHQSPVLARPVFKLPRRWLLGMAMGIEAGRTCSTGTHVEGSEAQSYRPRRVAGLLSGGLGYSRCIGGRNPLELLTSSRIARSLVLHRPTTSLGRHQLGAYKRFIEGDATTRKP